MKTLLPVTQVVSTKCGGSGAWIDNPLNTPAPGSGSWQGFQTGGSRGSKKRRHSTRRKYRHRRRNIYRQKSRKSRKHRKR